MLFKASFHDSAVRFLVDIVRIPREQWAITQVGHVMRQVEQVYTAFPEQFLLEAVEAMNKYHINQVSACAGWTLCEDTQPRSDPAFPTGTTTPVQRGATLRSIMMNTSKKVRGLF
jgi:hypothetical protein